MGHIYTPAWAPDLALGAESVHCAGLPWAGSTAVSRISPVQLHPRTRALQKVRAVSSLAGCPMPLPIPDQAPEYTHRATQRLDLDLLSS